jgi:hypothetical protein
VVHKLRNFKLTKIALFPENGNNIKPLHGDERRARLRQTDNILSLMDEFFEQESLHQRLGY